MDKYQIYRKGDSSNTTSKYVCNQKKKKTTNHKKNIFVKTVTFFCMDWIQKKKLMTWFQKDDFNDSFSWNLKT